MLSGPPPLGPGAEPLDRLAAFGRARLGFLLENREIARAALDGRTPVPFGRPAMMAQMHIRMLLRQMSINVADLDILAMRLTAALDVPLMLYMPLDDNGSTEEAVEERLSRGWEDLIRRVSR